MKDSILYFNEIGLQDVGIVGGKNASLGEIFRQLTPKGVLVPDGFATTAKVYQEFLKQNHLERKIATTLGEIDTQDFSNLSDIGSEVRSLLNRGVFPYQTQVQIIAAYNELVERVEMECFVVVRSSAISEELPLSSFAGQLKSYLNIKGENALLEACKNCFVSLFTDSAIKHSISQKFNPMDIVLSVGVQQMVGPEMLNGQVGFTLNKKDIKILSHWTDLIEDHFKMPMNIEWVKDSVNGKLYIVQVSPVN